MIFVTVGTTKFPFDRLLETVDKAMVDLSLKEELVVQVGSSNYNFKYRPIRVLKEIPFDEMVTYLKKARVLIVHGGPATIFLGLKYCKNKPLIVPRSANLGEHVDEHEVLFGKFLKSQKIAKIALPNENLTTSLSSFLMRPAPNVNKRGLVASPQLIKKLINLTVGYAK